MSELSAERLIEEILAHVGEIVANAEKRSVRVKKDAARARAFILYGLEAGSSALADQLRDAIAEGDITGAIIAAFELGRMAPPTGTHRLLLDQERAAAWRAGRRTDEQAERRALLPSLLDKWNTSGKTRGREKFLQSELADRGIEISRGTLHADLAHHLERADGVSKKDAQR